MPYSTLRLARRPSLSDMNTNTLSSALEPRSRLPIHSARLPGASNSRAGSELMTAMRPSQGAGDGGTVGDVRPGHTRLRHTYGEADHIRVCGMLHDEHIARTHRFQKFGRHDLPLD